MLANPIVLIVVAIVSLVIALVALERKFGVVTATIGALGKMFDKLLDKVDRVKDSFLGVGSVIGDLGDSLIAGPVSGVMSLLGGD